MNFRDLTDLIEFGNDKITISEDVILEEETFTSANADNLVIEGCNHTIDGNGQTFHLDNNSNLTVRNVEFKNFKTPYLMTLLKNNKTLSFINCKFINLDCGYGLISNKGNVIIDNCEFIGNDGVIHENYGNMKIIDSNFKDNSAEYTKTICKNFEDSTLIISNSTFSENFTKGDGLIHNKGTSKITDCSFHDNLARNNDICVIYNEKGVLTIEKCNFNNNRNEFCTNDYGGYFVSILNRSGNVFLKDSKFESENQGYGKSICNGGYFNIVGCWFKDSQILNIGIDEAPSSFTDRYYLKIEKSQFRDENNIIIRNCSSCKIISCDINDNYISNEDVIVISREDFKKLEESNGKINNEFESAKIVID
ncbi:right-handed parallel beta-helix repeat-containing protein [uncultured Methanobrevibacter sp.]|uniref:right-handed parallel beta-helix repeat-containing protein n=1 Tax=uncultured Methanobrevibacter sp. TaxID=253161 RepID=UPI0026333702|nr:right-handed parallel beta-helix repeat-containing protein [uncultured Methanobrevibacter sp.]